MPLYSYRIRDKFGTLITGKTEDEGIEKVRKSLSQKGYYIINIKKIGKKIQIFKFFKRRVKTQDILFFFRQLSVLIKAGIPIVTAIESIAKQVKNEYFQEVLANILEKIKTGDSLSNALKMYPVLFHTTYTSMIGASEASGKMEEVLARISGLMHKQERTKANIKAALTYPAVIFSVAVLVVSFILIFILPKFIAIYDKRVLELPIVTRILIFFSNVMSSYWYFILLGILLTIMLFKILSQNENILFKFHQFQLNVPYFGNIYFMSRLSNFAAILGFMYQSGVPMLKALRIIEKMLDNKVLNNVMKQAADSIELGDTLTNSLKRSHIMPDTFIKMMSAGEASGKIDELMLFISEYYDEEIEIKVKKMSTVLEPLMILIVGLIVGFIAVATLLPIFDLIKSFR